ncbi:MAG: DUF4347 domain-containing protein [Planctomycetota bacterium]
MPYLSESAKQLLCELLALKQVRESPETQDDRHKFGGNFEELEPRINLSVSMPVVDTGMIDPNSQFLEEITAEQASLIFESQIESAVLGAAFGTEAPAAEPRQLVIVDAAVENSEELIDILRITDSQANYEVHLLSRASDGVEQISQILDNFGGLYDAVHILSHGDDGHIQLGTGTLHHGNIESYAGEIASWSTSISADADIMIYGCNLAETEFGHSLIESVAMLTGADVAASDDITGASELGGDWDLEVNVGDVNYASLGAASWDGVLLTDTDGDGVGDANDLDSDNDGISDADEHHELSEIAASEYLTFRGSASAVSGNELNLTSEGVSSFGTAMSSQQINLGSDFTMSFQAYFGTNDQGADGMTFVLHNDPAGSNATGSSGQGLGAAGISNGVSIEFDTHKNTGESVFDHTAIVGTEAGDVLSSSVDFPNLEDGQWHDVVVSWDASTQTLSFTLDGTTAGSVTGDLVNSYFGGSDLVYFGFTGATGARSNDQSVRVGDFTGEWVDDAFLKNDIDNDGIANVFDLDSDNDGIADNIEAQTASGYIGPNGVVDSNGVDTAYTGGLTTVDSDNDGLADYLDTDSDDDGILDNVESGLAATTDATFSDVNGSTDDPATAFANTSGLSEVDFRAKKIVVLEGVPANRILGNFNSEVDRFDVSGLVNGYGEAFSTGDVAIDSDGNGNAKLIFSSEHEYVLTGVDPTTIDTNWLISAGIPDGSIGIEIPDTTVSVSAGRTTFVTIDPVDSDPFSNDTVSIDRINGQAISLGGTYTLQSGVVLKMVSETQFSVNGDNATESVENLTVRLSSESGNVATAVMSVVVTPSVTGTVVQAADDSFIVTTENEVSEGTVLLNDIDAEGDYIEVTHVDGQSIYDGTVALASGALITMNADGTFSYDQNGAFDSLDVGQSDTDTFNYTVADSDGSATVTVTMNIHAVMPTFPTDGATYQVHSSQGQLVTVDTVNKTLVNAQYQAKVKLNAVGLNTADNYAYGFNQNDKTLVQIGSNGQYIDLGYVDGMPSPNKGSYVGDFGPDGLLYVRPTSDISQLYGIDVTTQTVTNKIKLSTNLSRVFDITWNARDNMFYTVRRGSGGGEDALLSISLDGNITQIGTARIKDNTFGAMFSDANGGVYGISNQSGFVYQLDTTTGVATKVAEANPSGSNDGFSNPDQVIALAPLAKNDSFATSRTSVSGNLFEDNGSGIDIDGNGDEFEITAINGQTLSVGNQITLGSGALLTVNADATFSYDSNDVFTFEDGDVVTDTFSYTITDSTGLSSIAEVEVNLRVNSVSGTVFADLDKDGVQDSSEHGIHNALVTLSGIDTDGNSVERTTLTDVGGSYSFGQLADGNYQVTQANVEGYVDGQVIIGTGNGTAGESSVSGIEISGDTSNLLTGYNFAEQEQASILGSVFEDTNNDGVLDQHEIGIEGVTVVLTGTDVDGNAVNLTQQTDQDGTYYFDGLTEGSYSISHVQPGSHLENGLELGDGGGTISNGEFIGINLSNGDAVEGYNFAELESGEISGFVYADMDRDKSYDYDDVGLAGVTVTLTGVDDLGAEVSRTTSTDSDGKYVFSGLRSGTYTVSSADVPTLTDAEEQVGLFDGDSQDTAGTGVAGDNEITGIELGAGVNASLYNFRKLDDGYLAGILAQSTDEVVVFNGTAGDDVFDFVAGHSQHVVTLNGVEQIISADVRKSIHFMGGEGSDSVTITGTDHTEQAELRETSGKVTGTNYQVKVYNVDDIRVDGNGGEDRAFLYDTSGDDDFYVTEDLAHMTSSTHYSEVVGFHRVYATATAGFDEAQVDGTSARETFRGYRYKSVFFTFHVYFSMSNFDSVSVDAGDGGTDMAYIWDSVGDDTFTATENEATMSGDGFSIRVGDFSRVKAYARRGGNDVADLYDGAGDDSYYARPTFSKMKGDGFDNWAVGFEEVTGHAVNGGVDKAFMYDSQGADTFTFTTEQAVLTGDAFDNTANTFERVYAYATRGTDDVATLNDSAGDDVFRGNSVNARMYGDGSFYVLARHFDDVDAISTGGNDRAYLYDSDRNDRLVANANSARLFGKYFDNSAAAFSRTYAFASNGGYDTAIFNDSAGDDVFRTDSHSSRMYGDSYYNQARGFEQAVVNLQSLGSGDRTLFNDTSLDDFDAQQARILLEARGYTINHLAGSSENEVVDLILENDEWIEQ